MVKRWILTESYIQIRSIEGVAQFDKQP